MKWNKFDYKQDINSQSKDCKDRQIQIETNGPTVSLYKLL